MGSDIPGMPVGAGFLCKYSNKSDFGAVLLTESPVIKERYHHRMPFNRWLERNWKLILGRYPEVKANGLWIITSVCSTEACALNAWTSKEKEVVVGFSGSASQVASFDTKGEWHISGAQDGWTYYPKQSVST
jgi:hypothetical protein